MSKRKPHNMRARLERTCRALVPANHAAVVNIDPSGQQGLTNWNISKLLRVTGTTQLEMEKKSEQILNRLIGLFAYTFCPPYRERNANRA